MASRDGAFHVATTTRRVGGKIYRSFLLRRSIRDGKTVRHQTLGNLSHLPPDLIDTIRRRLAGESPSGGAWEIVRAYPHGHISIVLGVSRKLGLEAILASRCCRERSLVVAMIVARIVAPSSKLATLRALNEETATSSLGLELDLAQIQEEELYQALDWLGARQTRIENKLAKKHLRDGTLILYDVSSSYYTGRQSTLIKFGHNRDGKRDCPQIVYGMLCNADGCPVAIEVFSGNTADPTTLTAQVKKVRERFGVKRVVWVGDRGMITSRRIEEDFRGVDGLDWITALRADNIKLLASQGVIQPSLFDERDLAEVTSEDFPGERLMVCRNPLLAEERRRKREALLQATQQKLEAIAAATRRARNPLRGQDKIGLRVGRVLNQYKMAKHIQLTITDDNFTYERDEAKIAAEAALDGIYVIRTSVASDTLSSEDTVRIYKDLSKVERAFRSLKTIDLKVRPIFHWLDDRIRSHVFLCMLAYYVEWHLRQPLKSILFDDHERQAAEASRASVVTPAPRSSAAKDKDATKRTADDWPVESFRTLLANLATLTKNRVRISADSPAEFFILAQPTDYQKHVFELLELSS